MTQALGVAVVGFGWMGRVHTQAYLRVPHHFPQLEVRPELVAVADEVPGRAEEAAARYGFAMASRDWREVATDPRVRAVSITAPNFLHREIGTAMAEAGKHIWIEKPVGLTAADARAVAEAAAKAGVQGTVGFNYRNAPAVAAARELIRIEPSSPAAPDLNCLDINVSHGEARAETKCPRQSRHPLLGNGGRKTGSAWVDAAVHGDPGMGYGEPPPATLTENELVARPAPPRHSSKPDSTLIRYQEGSM
jgi:predicted dehydrogenase